MSPNLQVKLLRVLQEREFTPLGGTQKREVHVRIVAATNLDLRKEMEARRFREDLYYRLNVIQVEIPALRERRDDVPLLVQHFLEKQGRGLGAPTKRFDQEAMRCLLGHSWPGNVRQLENVVERAVTLSGARADLQVDDLPPEMQRAEGMIVPAVRVDGDGISLDAVMADFEGRLLYQALENTNWTKTRAARLLQIKRTTLIEKMKRLGIPLKGHAAGEGAEAGEPVAVTAIRR